MNLNQNEYFYIRNIQGGITKIFDENANIMVEYYYSAWGNILYTEDNSSNNLANINPYRYRGYRYDEDTSLYYLNSRYYNPEMGRFINADGIIGVMYFNKNTFSNNDIFYTSEWFGEEKREQGKRVIISNKVYQILKNYNINKEEWGVTPAFLV